MNEQQIFKKIPAIMREIEPIAKGRKNSQQGYSYRGVDDVMNELSPILAKHGVFPVTSISESGNMEMIKSKSGTDGFHCTRFYTFKLYAEDGSFVEGKVEGEASDYGDKAAGKAHSYAYRDFLMKTFCIPTEGDHDTDKHSPEFTVKKDQNFAAMTPRKLTLADAGFNKALMRHKDGEPNVFEKLTAAFELSDAQLKEWERETK
jgi:hypothetical protein